MANVGGTTGAGRSGDSEQLKDSPGELIVALGIDAERYPRTAAMDVRPKTPQAQPAYRKRKWIVEAPNWWINSALGFIRFSLRRQKKVEAEFKLVCVWQNLPGQWRLDECGNGQPVAQLLNCAPKDRGADSYPGPCRDSGFVLVACERRLIGLVERNQVLAHTAEQLVRAGRVWYHP